MKRCIDCAEYDRKTTKGLPENNFYNVCKKTGLILFPSRVLPMYGEIDCQDFKKNE